MSQIKTSTKKIKDIFSDYETNSNILDATVQGLNLIKKSNILELSIYSNKYIEIKDLWYFEKYLRERFQFENVEIRNII